MEQDVRPPVNRCPNNHRDPTDKAQAAKRCRVRLSGTEPGRGPKGDAAVKRQDVHVRLPVDWDSVDPIPDALAAIMAKPGTVDVPLDDVVPGEPEHARSKVPTR